MAGYDDDKFPKVQLSTTVPISTIVSSTATASIAQIDTSNLLAEAGAKQAYGIRSFIRVRQVERAPSDHPIYSFVGRIASEWAHLEHTLDLIIWDLAEIDPIKGACITAQMMGAIPRYRTIITQLKHRIRREPEYEKYISKVNTLLGSTHDTQERRNRIVHDPWYIIFDPGPGLLTRSLSEEPAQFKSMPHKEPRFGIESVDIAVIEKTIADIRVLSSKVEVLQKDISAALQASQQKQP